MARHEVAEVSGRARRGTIRLGLGAVIFKCPAMKQVLKVVRLRWPADCFRAVAPSRPRRLWNRGIGEVPVGSDHDDEGVAIGGARDTRAIRVA